MPNPALINHAQRLRAALELVPDATVPAELDDALTVIATVQNARTEASAVPLVAAVLATANPDDVDDRLDTAAARWQRSALVQAAAPGIEHAADQRLATALGRVIPDIVATVRPVFDDAARDLADAAKRLPDGTAALDPTAVLAADAGDAYKRAVTAADTLVTLAGVHTQVAADPDHGVPTGIQIVTVIDITGRIERLEYPHEVDNNTDPSNAPDVVARVKQVRRLFVDAATNRTLALVRAARGDYGNDIRLGLAADHAEVERRREHVRDAHMTRALRGAFA